MGSCCEKTRDYYTNLRIGCSVFPSQTSKQEHNILLWFVNKTERLHVWGTWTCAWVSPGSWLCQTEAEWAKSHVSLIVKPNVSQHLLSQPLSIHSPFVPIRSCSFRFALRHLMFSSCPPPNILCQTALSTWLWLLCHLLCRWHVDDIPRWVCSASFICGDQTELLK